MSFEKFNESKDKFPNFKKFEISGFTIILGKDSRSNDYITFQMADDDDIWMHVKGYPGSHVIVKTSENPMTKQRNLPDEEVIREAAKIAKKNSKVKNDSLVSVVYCQRKFVKKESGMNDGQVKVDYKNSHEIQI
jgi:predicted ribosome quality control (RQC) complex YloA/Tae2 family protein